MNKVELLGRTTADVELQKSKDGKEYARFTLAVQRKLDKEKTDFLDCVAFGKLAETIAKYVKKGNRIIVCGNIQTSVVEKEKAKTKYVTIVCDDFYFTESRKDVIEDSNDELPF